RGLAAATISVRVARQRPAVPPASSERRVRRDGIMSTVLPAGVNPGSRLPCRRGSKKGKALLSAIFGRLHSVRALTRRKATGPPPLARTCPLQWSSERTRGPLLQQVRVEPDRALGAGLGHCGYPERRFPLCTDPGVTFMFG